METIAKLHFQCGWSLIRNRRGNLGLPKCPVKGKQGKLEKVDPNTEFVPINATATNDNSHKQAPCLPSGSEQTIQCTSSHVS